MRKALAEIEIQATNFAAPAAAAEVELPRPSPFEAVSPGSPGLTVPAADIDDGRAAMKKIFVDGKVMSEVDFNALWRAPDLSFAPAKAEEPFLQALADRGVCPWENALKLMSEKTRLAYLPIEKYDVDIELARSYAKETCRRWCVLPFDRMSKSVLVATVNPFNKQAARELEQGKPYRLLWYLANPAELTKAINKIYR